MCRCIILLLGLAMAAGFVLLLVAGGCSDEAPRYEVLPNKLEVGFPHPPPSTFTPLDSELDGAALRPKSFGSAPLRARSVVLAPGSSPVKDPMAPSWLRLSFLEWTGLMATDLSKLEVPGIHRSAQTPLHCWFSPGRPAQARMEFIAHHCRRVNADLISPLKLSCRAQQHYNEPTSSSFEVEEDDLQNTVADKSTSTLRPVMIAIDVSFLHRSSDLSCRGLRRCHPLLQLGITWALPNRSEFYGIHCRLTMVVVSLRYMTTLRTLVLSDDDRSGCSDHCGSGALIPAAKDLSPPSVESASHMHQGEEHTHQDSPAMSFHTGRSHQPHACVKRGPFDDSMVVGPLLVHVAFISTLMLVGSNVIHARLRVCNSCGVHATVSVNFL